MKTRFFIAIGMMFMVAVATNAQTVVGRSQSVSIGNSSITSKSSKGQGRIILEYFPPIKDITLQQREKVGSILTKETKEVVKQLNNKQEIEAKMKNDVSGNSEKYTEKIKDIDNKIDNLKSDSNKKIKKILSESQYKEFLEKRNDFKFSQEDNNRLNSRNTQADDASRTHRNVPDEMNRDDY